MFWGPYIDTAPDLQVGFADGYRVSWQTSLGGSPPGLVYPNMRKWSGDHCSFDYLTIPGVLISGRRLDVERPADHRPGADDAEVLRRPDPDGDGRQAAVVSRKDR